MGADENKFVRRGPTLSGVGRLFKPPLMNITDKILLALKFGLTKKYSARKSQQYCQITRKVRFLISLSFSFTAG